MKKTIYVLALTTILFSACKNDKKDKAVAGDKHAKDMPIKTMDKQDDDHDHSGMNNMKTDSIKVVNINVEKNAATTPIIDAYLTIKNALVKDDKDGAAKGATSLLKTFASFDMTKLTEAQHKEYMDIVDDAKENAEHISESPIHHQREHFESLSTDINDLIKLLGTDKTLYQDFCPVAGEGKGAIWLSEYKDIKNPYQGSKMISCGHLKQQIN